ncbi:MAG: electron transport complex subunit E [Planctomycetes bacterium]|nr:electron transport complex subunit E [Planctomycetota bacterium]
MAKNVWTEFRKGLWEEIPPFRLVLGLCPTLAVTKSVGSGLGMGLATTFVLLCSNVIISSLRKTIPRKVRIAAYIVVIATFVVIVELVTQAYFYPLYQQLGIFVPLIVVNCIILGRAEAFASRNGIALSAADGLGMGLGFTIALTIVGSIREIIGAGTWFGIGILGTQYEPFTFMVEAPGAFVCLGLLLALMNAIGRKV